jgi:cytochrome c oxidase cbb3-type subunit 1
LTFQKVIHFTDWVVGHAHLVMFGVFSMWIFGFMTYLMPRLFGRAWYSAKLLEVHFWCSAAGVFIMFLDLTLSGMFQGYSWAALLPWQDMLGFSQPFWITRIFAGLIMFAGFLCFLYNIFMTVIGAEQPASEATVAPA